MIWIFNYPYRIAEVIKKTLDNTRYGCDVFIRLIRKAFDKNLSIMVYGNYHIPEILKTGKLRTLTVLVTKH